MTSSALFASSVTSELAAAITKAQAALPAAHRTRPIQDEVVANPDAGIERIQNWAFCEHLAIAVCSRSTTRVRLQCVHHHTETRNTRKTEFKDRRRVETSTQAMGCKFEIYIRQLKRRGGVWAIGWSPHHEHTHEPNPDPFRYTQHRHRRSGHAAAVVLATAHRGEISYKQSARILMREGLHLDSKEYYNLQRRRDSGKELTKEEQLELLLHSLEVRDFRVRTREEYLIDDKGERRARIARDIFICSSDILIGITNTGQTFPLAFVFISVESAEMFRWVHEQLTKLIFYDCPLPRVVAGDFAAGLAAAMATAKEQVAAGMAIMERGEGEKADEESTGESISDVRRQTGSQQKGNLFAVDSFEVEVDIKEDSPPLSTRRSGRSKAPSRKIQSQQRRDLEKKTAKEIKAARTKRGVRRGGKAKVRVEMTTQFEDTMQEFGVNLTITSSSQYSSSE
ncbi:MAG: hypothetical protein M1839_005959 [Geoglossum umbratile]|nr:MAG: hypothetical protein M1839_005959 [Geoglossum umbratile]